MSAENASKSWTLRCFVRERLIAFLQEEYPESLPRVRADIQGAGGAAAKTTEDAATHP
jgi:hypothetical protein